MRDFETQYNIKEEKNHVVYIRKHNGMTVENKFPRQEKDVNEQIETFRSLVAQMIMRKLEG